MRAKKRVVTGTSAPSAPAGRSKRTPTVRTIKSAIVTPKAGAAGKPGAAGWPGGPSAPGVRAGAGGSAAASSSSSPIAGLGSPAISPVADAAYRPGSSGRPGPAVDLSVEIGRGLVLPNPILAASGTFGYGVEYADVVDVQRLGAICCKGTTLKPRAGNRPPRVTETPAGMLNSIGLQNAGVDAVLERYGPLWASWAVPVIVNVAGESIEEYVAVVRRCNEAAGVAGIELNISCPNVGKGGLQFAIDQEAASAVTRAVRRATDLPLIVKLSPNVADVRPIARAIADAGADALSAINTLSGMALNADRTGPFLGNTYGGLSGPAIKPVALRIVYEVSQVVAIPVIAIGGVTGIDDVLDYLAAGAVAVQVGTAIFADPTLPVRLIDILAAECATRGLGSVDGLVGTALPKRPVAASAKGVEYRP
jgi:dihydroorotate dehydrogenase (NAD+) catalytic subunit